jgi:hypothetical protein
MDHFIQLVFTLSNVQNKLNNYSNLIQDGLKGVNGEHPAYPLTSSAGFSSVFSD